MKAGTEKSWARTDKSYPRISAWRMNIMLQQSSLFWGGGRGIVGPARCREMVVVNKDKMNG